MKKVFWSLVLYSWQGHNWNLLYYLAKEKKRKTFTVSCFVIVHEQVMKFLILSCLAALCTGIVVLTDRSFHVYVFDIF